MSHTEETWKTGDPYGRPQPKGNADEAWQSLTSIPCPVCGAQAKTMIIDGREATIICHDAEEDFDIGGEG